jgi:hypothetical protein
MKLVNLSKKVQDLLHMTSMNAVFDIQKNEASAIRSFDQAAGTVHPRTASGDARGGSAKMTAHPETIRMAEQCANRLSENPAGSPLVCPFSSCRMWPNTSLRLEWRTV